jgi:hypothetical protein
MNNLDVSNMTATEIDNKKVEQEKLLKIAQANLHTVELQELDIAKQIIILRGKQKDLQILISKAKQIVRTSVIDIKILNSAFWRARDSGL